MGIFKVSDRLHHHPNVMQMRGRLRLSSLGVWVMAGSWCAGNDVSGYIARSTLRTLDATQRCIDELVRVGLFDESADGDGYWLAHGNHNICDLWEIERTDYRRKISRWVREQVYARDSYACVTCGSQEQLSIDHIHPWSLGGSDLPINLQTMCRPCNSRKGARI